MYRWFPLIILSFFSIFQIFYSGPAVPWWLGGNSKKLKITKASEKFYWAVAVHLWWRSYLLKNVQTLSYWSSILLHCPFCLGERCIWSIQESGRDPWHPEQVAPGTSTGAVSSWGQTSSENYRGPLLWSGRAWRGPSLKIHRTTRVLRVHLFHGHSFTEEEKRGYFMEPFQLSPKPLSHRGPTL